MVLGGIDPSEKKVYVYDPYNRNNKKYRNTGNGWYSFNDIIVPETKAYFIIEKKGQFMKLQKSMYFAFERMKIAPPS